MLLNSSGEPILNVKDEGAFLQKLGELTEPERQALHAEMDVALDSVPVGKKTAASWVASKDKDGHPTGRWAGTPRMPIYERLFAEVEKEAGRFYGRAFEFHVIHRPDLWKLNWIRTGRGVFASYTLMIRN